MGRIAVVTGAARGIGRGIAERLAAEGHRVAVLDLDGAAAEDAAREIAGEALGLACDVTDSESLSSADQILRSRWGPAEMLVSCAGISRIAALEDTSDELWERILSVNLTGAFRACRQFIPPMREAGWGRAVMISSESGKRGASRYSAYCASKFGLIGLTQSLAQEFADAGITVNAVCPGIVFTDLWDDRHLADYGAKRGIPAGEVRDYLVGRVPLRRACTPEDVAAAVAFLVSDDASYLTGQALNLTGGTLMQ